MAILKETFCLWIQEISELFNSTLELEGVIEGELVSIKKIWIYLAGELKNTAYKKKTEMMNKLKKIYK